MANCTKNKHPNQWAAAQALRAIATSYGPSKPKVPVAVYPCASCHAWHLTSQRQYGKSRKWNVLAT